MNWDRIEGNWKTFKGQARQQWGKLTDSDLDVIAGKRDELARDRDRLKNDSVRLAALVEERQRKQSAIEKDMEAEGARAINLSRQVDGLQGLITKMEQDLKSAAKAAATASLQGAPAAPGGKPNLGALKDPARLTPAIAFASATHDIAYDAYTVEVLRRDEMGIATGWRTAAYRLAMLVSGGAAVGPSERDPVPLESAAAPAGRVAACISCASPDHPARGVAGMAGRSLAAWRRARRGAACPDS